MIDEADQKEVQAVIHRMIGWALTKDIDGLLGSVAQDDDFFIYHPDSKSNIVGFEAFKRMVERSFMRDSFKATGYAIRDLRIRFGETGGSAWFSGMLDDHCEWNGRPSGWDDCRWTGTLEKRAGRWVMVQMHFSFPKDD